MTKISKTWLFAAPTLTLTLTALVFALPPASGPTVDITFCTRTTCPGTNDLDCVKCSGIVDSANPGCGDWWKVNGEVIADHTHATCPATSYVTEVRCTLEDVLTLVGMDGCAGESPTTGDCSGGMASTSIACSSI